MTNFKEMTLEQLHERLLETREFQRITKIQRDQLDEQVMSLGYQCDDILDAIRERRGLRLVECCRG